MQRENLNVRIFVSHSHIEREIAGAIKDALEKRFVFEVFVAHDDINPAEEWQNRIQDEIKDCDAFVALLTENFRNSKWTDQETGMALALEKPIIPIKFDMDPYGFISKYQALKWKSDAQEESISELVKTLYEKIFGKLPLNDQLERFTRSWTFEDAGYKSALLLRTPKFTKNQINIIAQAVTQNDQISQSFKARANLRPFFKKYQDSIDPELMTKLMQIFRSLG